MNDVQLQYLISRDVLVSAIEELHELKRACEMEPEMKMTARRMDAYILPHLESWATDKDQPGSLADIQHDIEEAYGPTIDEDTPIE